MPWASWDRTFRLPTGQQRVDALLATLTTTPEPSYDSSVSFR
jgi:hypothetical protein